MFNGILRDPEDDAPTDPLADPITDLSVLPIPIGSLTFGAGSHLKNVVSTIWLPSTSSCNLRCYKNGILLLRWCYEDFLEFHEVILASSITCRWWIGQRGYQHWSAAKTVFPQNSGHLFLTMLMMKSLCNSTYWKPLEIFLCCRKIFYLTVKLGRR